MDLICICSGNGRARRCSPGMTHTDALWVDPSFCWTECMLIDVYRVNSQKLLIYTVYVANTIQLMLPSVATTDVWVLRINSVHVHVGRLYVSRVENHQGRPAGSQIHQRWHNSHLPLSSISFCSSITHVTWSFFRLSEMRYGQTIHVPLWFPQISTAGRSRCVASLTGSTETCGGIWADSTALKWTWSTEALSPSTTRSGPRLGSKCARSSDASRCWVTTRLSGVSAPWASLLLVARPNTNVSSLPKRTKMSLK